MIERRKAEERAKQASRMRNAIAAASRLMKSNNADTSDIGIVLGALLHK